MAKKGKKEKGVSADERQRLIQRLSLEQKSGSEPSEHVVHGFKRGHVPKRYRG